MQAKNIWVLLLSAISFFLQGKEAQLITLNNQTNKAIFAAVYCEPILIGATVTREYTPVEVGPNSQEPVQRPKSTMGCNRYLVVASDVAQLTRQLDKKKFSKLSTIGVGITTFGRVFDYFYVIEKNNQLGLYNPFSYLASGKITTLQQFAQTQAARLMRYDSVLINKNPYKDMQATIRVSTQLNPDEQLYVNKRKQKVKTALEKLTGKKLNDKNITIAAINSGGGTRAMICMLGFHIGMLNTGLLDALMYDVGLSGGSWFVSLWLQSKKSLPEFKKELRHLVQLGSSYFAESKSRKMTKEERSMFADALLVRAALEQPVTLVNFWGALLATRYLEPYGKERQAIRLSRSLTGNDAFAYPFPILTAVSGYGYDDTLENRTQMNWYEFTPYEVGGVGNWLGNAFVPTWAFGRRFLNKISQDFNPEYDLGLLMGIWGSAFAVSYARAYQELTKQLGPLKDSMQLIRKKLMDENAFLMFQQERISVAKVHNFTRNVSGLPYTDKRKLLMVDAGLAFNLPYPPVSGEGARKADILIFLDASGGIEKSGGKALKQAAEYARKRRLKFPNLPKDAMFKEETKKAVSIYKDENDPEVPLVIYISRLIDQSTIKYDAAIPKDFITGFPTLKLYYTGTEFDRISLATQQNVEQSMAMIKEAIDWKMAQLGAFADEPLNIKAAAAA